MVNPIKMGHDMPTEHEKLERFAIVEFKKHWNRIAKNLNSDVNRYARKKSWAFEADTEARREILANRYYGKTHVEKMCILEDKAIRRKLSCYLAKAIKVILANELDNFVGNDPSEQKAFVRKLIQSEYILFESFQCHPIDSYNENASDITVDGYPSVITSNDDWYERISGRHSYFTSILMKSTGEPFTTTEIGWLKNSIRDNIDTNGPDLLWGFECEPLAKNKLWIKVYEFNGLEYQYLEEVLKELLKLSIKQLKCFVKEMCVYLTDNLKINKEPLILSGYEKMGKEILYQKVTNLILEYWKTRKLKELDIREIENIMNKISGRIDRDYHSKLNI